MRTDLSCYTLYDALPTFLDENGKVVIGRLIFFEADGTTYKPIYADQNYQTLLSNPLLTDMAGRPEHQVFLKNGLYRVVLEKFLGTNYADMGLYLHEGYDPNHTGTVSHWQFVKEFVIDSGTVDEAEITGENIFVVQYISELRSTDYSKHPLVTVIDYDENIRNITPRTYIWEPNSSRDEDYGATIISSLSNSGRWILLESSIMESTTFGISPYTDPGVLMSRLNGLSVYSQAGYGKANEIYFQGGTYPLVRGANIKFGKHVVCSESLQFTVSSDSAKVIFNKGITYTGTTTLNSEGVALVIKQDVIHSKWFYNAGPTVFDGSYGYWKTVILDHRYMHNVSANDLIIEIEDPQMILNATNCIVRFNVAVESNGSTFTDCKFEKAMGNFKGRATFTGDSIIYPWMFNSTHDLYNLTLGPNIKYDLYDWGAQKYADLKIVQDNHVIGSLDEGVINITLLRDSADVNDVYVIENGSGTIDCHSLNVNIELHNFSGTISNLNSGSTINAVDSYISIIGVGISSLQMQRGALLPTTASDFNIYNGLYLSEVTVNMNFIAAGSGAIETFNNCTIMQNITVNNIATFEDCKIEAVIYTLDDASTDATILRFYENKFFKNVFGTNGLVYLTSQQTGIVPVVKSQWVGNISNHDFISDAFWLNYTIPTNRLIAQYKYQDNHGGCPEDHYEYYTAEYPQMYYSVMNRSGFTLQDSVDYLHSLGAKIMYVGSIENGDFNKNFQFFTSKFTEDFDYTGKIFYLHNLEPHATAFATLEASIAVNEGCWSWKIGDYLGEQTLNKISAADASRIYDYPLTDNPDYDGSHGNYGFRVMFREHAWWNIPDSGAAPLGGCERCTTTIRYGRISLRVSRVFDK